MGSGPKSSSAPGSCLCGAVRFVVSLPSLISAHCHCSMCRRAHGAGFVTWLTVPKSQLTVTGGADVLVRYDSSDHATRSFCGTCGSSLFFETSHRADQIDVVLSNLDGPADRAPQLHIFFDDRAEWIEVNDALPRLGGASGMEPL